ncbi:HD domain-containing protein [Candidatus Falkowbacteria bacterium]|nr:HD domain-containing protein [Candidatus Falkowbacteria bacterium]
MTAETMDWPLPIAEKQFDNAAAVVAGLYTIPRTGWVQRGVDNPESVGQHTDALVTLARELGPQIAGLDQKKLERMLQIHDWPEALVGDQVAFSSTEKQQKFLVERAAMQKICAALGDEGAEIMNLWLEYTDGQTGEASIAKQLDKLQALMQATTYERAGQTVRARDFVHYRAMITHPLLRQMLAELEK